MTIVMWHILQKNKVNFVLFVNDYQHFVSIVFTINKVVIAMYNRLDIFNDCLSHSGKRYLQESLFE
jgi:hypothetical protein